MRPSSRDEDSKPTSLLSRIKRSMSLSSESGPFALTSKNDSQRRSTFYLTDPINIDISEDSTDVETRTNTLNYIPEEKTTTVIESQPEVIQNLKKTKLSRPKCPPPPVPTILGKYFRSC